MMDSCLADAPMPVVVGVPHAHGAIGERDRCRRNQPVLRVVGVGQRPVVHEVPVGVVERRTWRAGGARHGRVLVERVGERGAVVECRGAEAVLFVVHGLLVGEKCTTEDSKRKAV